jgi:DNA-binding LytR/AlgR family response regulator
MDKIKALIIDDEELARKIIREYLEIHPEVEVMAECRDAFQAIKAIEKFHPDLLFLDIQMPEVSGFELLEMLDEIPHVIFSTAYEQYALQAFEINAVDYLLKPYVQNRFDMAVERVKQNIRQERSESGKIQSLLNNLRSEKTYLDRILIKQSGKIIIIKVEEIVWIEAMEDYVNFHISKGSYLVKQSLSRLESRMNPEVFIRVHRSYTVNLEAVKEIEPWTNGRLRCLMKNGQEIVTSRSGAKKLKKLIL